MSCCREVQETLVEIGDKDASFIGSQEWIGSMDLCYVLDKLLGVSKFLTTVRVKFHGVLLDASDPI